MQLRKSTFLKANYLVESTILHNRTRMNGIYPFEYEHNISATGECNTNFL